MSSNIDALGRFFEGYRGTRDAIISDRLAAWARAFGRIRRIGEETAGVRFKEFARRFNGFRPGFRTAYREYLEVLRLEAPAFNVFDLFGLTNDENRHSDFISALLDPHGPHGQGSLFLDGFLDLLRERGAGVPERRGHIAVKREKPTEDVKGRIDISIEMPGAESCCLIVENKIWSGAHSLQLERYYYDGINRRRKVILVYLTPYGEYPKETAITPALRSKLQREGVLFALSYITDVVAWLTAALKNIEAGRLLNTLRMYIDVLERWRRRGA